MRFESVKMMILQSKMMILQSKMMILPLKNRDSSLENHDFVTGLGYMIDDKNDSWSNSRIGSAGSLSAIGEQGNPRGGGGFGGPGGGGGGGRDRGGFERGGPSARDDRPMDTNMDRSMDVRAPPGRDDRDRRDGGFDDRRGGGDGGRGGVDGGRGGGEGGRPPAHGRVVSPPPPEIQQEGPNWECPNPQCKNDNWPRRTACNRCGVQRPPHGGAAAPGAGLGRPHVAGGGGGGSSMDRRDRGGFDRGPPPTRVDRSTDRPMDRPTDDRRGPPARDDRRDSGFDRPPTGPGGGTRADSRGTRFVFTMMNCALKVRHFLFHMMIVGPQGGQWEWVTEAATGLAREVAICIQIDEFVFKLMNLY